jgi:GGDEF domain-containing protein/DNA-binding NarL/FixJ family response regulator
MRSPCRFGIVEAFPGSLAGFPDLLARWGYASRLLSAAELVEPGAPVDLAMVDAGCQPGLDTLRWVIGRRRGGPPVAALARRDDPTLFSHALALGCADALAFPLRDDELRLRIAALAALAVAHREQERRAALLATYAEPAARTSRARAGQEPPRAEVLVVGPAGEQQVRIANGVGPATLSYADSAAIARRMLAERRFDLLVVTLAEAGDAPLIEPGSGQLATLTRDCAKLLAGPLPGAAGVAAAIAAGFDDVVAVPEGPEAIRLRFEFWLNLQRLRRSLREPERHPGARYALDAPSGLFHEGFLLDHLSDRFARAEGPLRQPIVVLSLAGLDGLGRACGHGPASRLVARAGEVLRRAIRAEDLAAHLGRGQFVVVLAGEDASTAGAVPARLRAHLTAALAQELAGPPPVSIGAAASEIRYLAEAERVIARSFRDLAWEQRRVA